MYANFRRDVCSGDSCKLEKIFCNSGNSAKKLPNIHIQIYVYLFISCVVISILTMIMKCAVGKFSRVQ